MTTLQEKTGHADPQSSGGGVGENSFSNITHSVNIESVKKEEDWQNIEVKPEKIIPWTLESLHDEVNEAAYLDVLRRSERSLEQSQNCEEDERSFLDTKIEIQEEELITKEAALEQNKKIRRRIKKAYFRELVRRISIVCDLCDDDSAQRAIKLNAKERFAAAVVLKKSLSLGLRPKKVSDFLFIIYLNIFYFWIFLNIFFAF